jgi:integrase
VVAETNSTNSIKLKLTDRAITSTLKQNPEITSIWDEEAPGLRLKKGYLWHFTRRVNGKQYDRKLGERSLMPIPEARKKASTLFLSLDGGVDPLKVRKQEEAKKVQVSVTFKEALEAMLVEGEQRDSTKNSYRQLLNKKSVFRNLADEALFSLDGETLKKLHRNQSKTSESQANKHARTVRALWNWSCKHYGVKLDNPADALGKGEQVSGQRGWNRPKRRKTTIQRHQLKPWFAAVHKLQSDEDTTTRRQALALEVMVLTGLRRDECLHMEWDWVSWPDLTVTVPDLQAKNGMPLELPIPDRVVELLRNQEGEHPRWVFPSATQDKPLYAATKAQEAIQEETGLWVCPNDCRRTFSTAGPAAGVPQQLVKGLMNHLTDAEVTAGYQVHGIDTLRESIQKIEDYIQTEAGLRDKSLDRTLAELLRTLTDDEKRKLIFELSAKQAEGRKHG